LRSHRATPFSAQVGQVAQRLRQRALAELGEGQVLLIPAARALGVEAPGRSADGEGAAQLAIASLVVANAGIWADVTDEQSGLDGITDGTWAGWRRSNFDCGIAARESRCSAQPV